MALPATHDMIAAAAERLESALDECGMQSKAALRSSDSMLATSAASEGSDRRCIASSRRLIDESRAHLRRLAAG